MKKKLLILSTLSISAIAISSLAILLNKDNIFKTKASDKTITLDHTKSIALDGDSDLFMGNGNVTLGKDTYIYTDIYGDYVNFKNNTDNYLSFYDGDWGAEIYIRLDIRGLTSFKINGNATPIEEYGTNYMNIFYDSYLLKNDGVTVDDSPIESLTDLKLNRTYEVDTSTFYTESILILINNFISLDISSIELTTSCMVNI